MVQAYRKCTILPIKLVSGKPWKARRLVRVHDGLDYCPALLFYSEGTPRLCFCKETFFDSSWTFHSLLRLWVVRPSKSRDKRPELCDHLALSITLLAHRSVCDIGTCACLVSNPQVDLLLWREWARRSHEPDVQLLPSDIFGLLHPRWLNSDSGPRTEERTQSEASRIAVCY